MIRTKRMTPSVYCRHSRDFQFIGRLYDMVLNSVKTNADLIYSLPNSEDADTAFLELLSMTLGFKSIHNYNIDQLKSLCSCFAEIIRNKGNIQSITKACNALIGAEGITDGVYIDDTNYKEGLVLYVSQELSDINLLRDLLNYILPAGLSYNIVKTLQLSGSGSTVTKINSTVTATTTEVATSTVSQIKDTYENSDVTKLQTNTELLTIGGTLMNSTITDNYIGTTETITTKTWTDKDTE